MYGDAQAAEFNKETKTSMKTRHYCVANILRLSSTDSVFPLEEIFNKDSTSSSVQEHLSCCKITTQECT